MKSAEAMVMKNTQRSARLMRQILAIERRSIRPQPIMTSEAAIADFGR